MRAEQCGVILSNRVWCRKVYERTSMSYGWLDNFTSWQHLKSYQDRYWLVTVQTHGDFIVLPHCEIRLTTPWPDILPSYIALSLRQDILGTEQNHPATETPVFTNPNNVERLSRKWHIYIFKSLVWIDQGSKPRLWIPPDLPMREMDAQLIWPSGLVSVMTQA